MKAVTQTRFGRPVGNCWAACIASILELPIEAVDWSADMTAEEIEPGTPGEGTDKGNVADEWLRRRDERIKALGYFMLRQFWTPDLQTPPGVHYIALGENQRGVGHACVYLEGRLVHDPNPDGGGLRSIEDIAVLVRR